MKTYMAKPGEVEAKWWLVDAKDKVVGRLASDIAMILMGKHEPTYTPHIDTGDFVVVINADKVVLTGSKETRKTFMSYSGWKGGERYRTVSEVRASHPERLITHAVKGMLPKNRLGAQLLRKLKVYVGDQHPHAAQQPAPMAATN